MDAANFLFTAFACYVWGAILVAFVQALFDPRSWRSEE